MLLMGLGPLIAWRRASLRALGGSVAIAGGGAPLPRAPRSPRGGGGEPGRARRLHVCGVRPRGDRARVRPRDACPQGARRRRLGGGVHVARSGATGAGTAATSIHAAIALLDGRRRRRRRVRLARAGAAPAPGDAMEVGGYTLRLHRRRRTSGSRTARSCAPSSPSPATGSRSATLAAGKNRYFPENEGGSRTRSRSAPTGCGRRTSSSSASSSTRTDRST